MKFDITYLYRSFKNRLEKDIVSPSTFEKPSEEEGEAYAGQLIRHLQNVKSGHNIGFYIYEVTLVGPNHFYRSWAFDYDESSSIPLISIPVGNLK